MADYDKDFIFYDDSDDELVDVSNGIKTAEESANSKKGAKHSPSGAHHYAGVFSYEDENKRKKKKVSLMRAPNMSLICAPFLMISAKMLTRVKKRCNKSEII
mgnify:CR=1 FL=1